MIVKNKLTKEEYTIPPDVWDKIKAKGEANKYTIVSNADSAPQPDDIVMPKYGDKMSAALDLEKEEKFEDALALYREAQAINNTSKVSKKIKELEALLS